MPNDIKLIWSHKFLTLRPIRCLGKAEPEHSGFTAEYRPGYVKEMVVILGDEFFEVPSFAV